MRVSIMGKLLQTMLLQGYTSKGRCVRNDCKFDLVDIHRSLTTPKNIVDILMPHVKLYANNQALADVSLYLHD